MSHGTADEESPLLPLPLVKCTPIPWFQISIVAFISLAEPLTSQVIFPFAPQASTQWFSFLDEFLISHEHGRLL